jgi:hypothetical protein
MELSDLKKDKDYFTAKCSDINRQLAFAGIAVIWIFKSQNSEGLKIPSELILPILLFVISLFLDLLHYLYGSIVWSSFFRYQEKRHGKLSNVDIKAPKIFSNIMYVIFYLKILVCLIAFIYLSKYIFNVLT